jgi:hypothetical protein
MEEKPEHLKKNCLAEECGAKLGMFSFRQQRNLQKRLPVKHVIPYASAQTLMTVGISSPGSTFALLKTGI